jgi:hypothetical protein
VAGLGVWEEVGFGKDILYSWTRDWNHHMGDQRSKIVGLFGSV